MNILEKSGNLTMADMYKLTKSPEIGKLSTIKGEELEIEQFIVYEDTNISTGEITRVAGFESTQGELFATNSKTFVNDFLDIIAMCREAGAPLPSIVKVFPRKGKSGREYIQCVYIA